MARVIPVEEGASGANPGTKPTGMTELTNQSPRNSSGNSGNIRPGDTKKHAVDLLAPSGEIPPIKDPILNTQRDRADEKRVSGDAANILLVNEPDGTPGLERPSATTKDSGQKGSEEPAPESSPWERDLGSTCKPILGEDSERSMEHQDEIPIRRSSGGGRTMRTVPEPGQGNRKACDGGEMNAFTPISSRHPCVATEFRRRQELREHAIRRSKEEMLSIMKRVMEKDPDVPNIDELFPAEKSSDQCTVVAIGVDPERLA